jgi:hypothetical protein
MFERPRPPVPAGHVRIVSVQSMLDPWTGEVQVAVLYEGPDESCVVMMTEERCAELQMRKAARDCSVIPRPHWRR